MIRSIRMLVLLAWSTECLLMAPPLNAQLLAHQQLQHRGDDAKTQPGTLSLRDALMQLKKQFGVDILFEEKLLEGLTVSSSQINPGKSVERNLLNLLQPTGLRFKKVSKGAFVILAVRLESKTTFQSVPASSPVSDPERTASEALPSTPAPIALPNEPTDRTITGTVTSETGEELPGVSVVVKNTNRGTTTDANGRFRMSIADGSTTTLIFSFVGYQSQEVAIGNRTLVTIKLAPDQKTLNEVVVVGYGTQQKRDVTGSVAKVTVAQITATPIMSPEQGLQGRAPGVQVIQSNNAPGGGAQVQIRGVGSFNGGTSNEPLYVIDGVPVYNDGQQLTNLNRSVGDNGSNGNSNYGSPLANINPNDIESMDILKDASATAIYGSRAANGVVLITTKSGKAGKPKFNIDYYYGVQQVRKTYNLLNATEAMVLANEAISNERGASALSGAYTESFNPYSYAANPTLKSYDWQDIMYRQGSIQDASISASGGTEKGRYSTSLNYYANEGIVVNSNMRRVSIRSNLDAQPTKWLTLGLRSNYSNQWGNQVHDNDYNNSLVTRAIESNPYVPALNPDGTYYGTPALGNQLNSFYGDFGTNPYYELKELQAKLTRNRLQGSVFAEISLFDGLSFRSTFGGDYNQTNQHYAMAPIARGVYGDYTSYYSGSGGGLVKDLNATSLNWVADQVLTYNATFNQAHKLNATLGFSAQNFAVQNASISSGSGSFNADLNQVNNANADPSKVTTSGSYVQSGLVSQFVRVNYSYRDKYLFTGTVRRDGSSRFGPENRYGYFPSASVGWRISEEPFLKNQRLVNDFKFRASWGLTGNQNIGDFRFISTTSNNSYAFGNTAVNGVSPGNIANPGLQWEANQQVDIGLDIGFLNNRILLTADYYVKRSNNLLYNVPISLTSGFGSQIANLGKVENRGLELGITSQNITGPFKWSTNANFSTLTNTVLDIGVNQAGVPNILYAGIPNALGQNTSFEASTNVTKAGIPIGSFYGYIFDGIIQNQSQVESAPKIANVLLQPGDVRYKDLNGDGLIDINDRTVIGNPFPKFYGGITNEFSYKNFTLSVFANFTVGNDILNLARVRGLLRRGAGLADQLNRWTGEGTTNEYPRILYSGANFTANDTRMSTRYLEDGSFIRLKAVTLAYNVPSVLASKIKLANARIYFTANNLAVLTRYKGSDPEVSGNGSFVQTPGIDNANYPVAQSFLLGVNLSF